MLKLIYRPIHNHETTIETTKKALVSWEPHGPRLLKATFKSSQKEINVKIILGYAPTNDSSEDEKDDFYEKLESVIQKNHKSKDMTILLGDFNAKVGKEKDAFQQAIGKESLHEENVFNSSSNFEK